MNRPDFKDFNIADWFSFYRIAVAPVLLVLLVVGERQAFTWMLLISYSTDAIDGMLARGLGIASARGSQLDSIGDQVIFVTGLIGICVFEWDFIVTNHLPIILALVPYALQVALALWKYGRVISFHTYLAKTSAVIQAVFILWLLFFEPVYWLFYTMIVIAIVETAEEIVLLFMYDRWVAGVKGIPWALDDERRRG